MLAYNHEGSLCLEDVDGKVTLDITHGVRSHSEQFSDNVICFWFSAAYQ